MRPQDLVVLLKILCYKGKNWLSKGLAADLSLSTAEISNALNRCVTSGLIDAEKKNVRTQALLEFIMYGLRYVFPQQPGATSRGIPTAHAHPYMEARIISDQKYVWPDADSDERGLSVQPLYPGVVEAVKKDDELYLLLALVDVLRVGRAREKDAAIIKLKEVLAL
ncbi:MAG: hypothetical protein V4649_04925 [Bacteroidota bacterium]